MYSVGIILECNAGVGFEVVDINVFINVDYVFTLWVDFNKDLLLAHLFDYFSDVGSWFLEVVEFFAEHADFGVECVAVCFEALEVSCAFLYGLMRCDVISNEVS